MLKVLPCKILNITALLVLPVSFLLGQGSPYGESICVYETDRWKLINVFDWTAMKTLRMDLILDHFSSETNTYGSLTCIEKKTGVAKFVIPSGPFTDLWISPDSKYIVALSDEAYINPVQILIIDNDDGKRLYKKTFANAYIKLSSTLYYEFIQRFQDLKIPAMYISRQDNYIVPR